MKPLKGRYARIRYREGAWEMRCDDCAVRGGQRFWPIDIEFWIPGNASRCRACQIARRRRIGREISDPYYRAIKADPVRYAAYLERHRRTEAARRARQRRAAQMEQLRAAA